MVLTVALLYLCRWSDLQKYELVAAAILVVVIAALASGLERGLVDLMFVRLIEYFKEKGYDTFNLGLCPLANVGEHPGASLQERAVYFLY